MESHAPQFRRAAPYLLVADLGRAITYYVESLGFREEYRGGAPPVFAILSRDGFPLMLRLADEPERIVPNEKQGGTWDVFFWVHDVKALHEELVGRGAHVQYPVVHQAEYHMDECAFRDLDGYVLGFGQERA
jgi:catechol 2,3-dioxygenase-like lactoylglutathione lyase family enzyme